MQAVVKTALEPEWEAHFEPCSYGFRPGRGCHDAIGQLGSFPARELVRQWLKAGYMEDGVLHDTEMGTPQGGVISPLLANIAIHGMEATMGIRYNNRGENIARRGMVRYADDFVIFCESEADAIAARAEMAVWLAPRGLRLSEKKTRIVHLSKGFNFPGFNVRQYLVPTTRTGWKLLIKPSREAVKKFISRLRGEWRKMRGQNITAVLRRFNPVIRGWANYYRGVVSKEIFAAIDMFHHEVRWAKCTHPKKPWYWLKRRYWGRLRRTSRSPWVFGDAIGSRAPASVQLDAYRATRHLKGRNSPDDPSPVGVTPTLAADSGLWQNARTASVLAAARACTMASTSTSTALSPNGSAGKMISTTCSSCTSIATSKFLPTRSKPADVSGLLEPCAGKLACAVLRGVDCSDAIHLPDRAMSTIAR
jgi:RNA-directed DNA polymerase